VPTPSAPRHLTSQRTAGARQLLPKERFSRDTGETLPEERPRRSGHCASSPLVAAQCAGTDERERRSLSLRETRGDASRLDLLGARACFGPCSERDKHAMPIRDANALDVPGTL
jgi:hypothetical protein